MSQVREAMQDHLNSKINPQPLGSNPEVFKGIALFTPGGDVVYCLDREKQTRWHLHLCIALQQLLDLPEPPHFLVPCYTATLDRWRDPQTQQVQTIAEAAPLVLRFQSLLNALFNTGELLWQPTSLPSGVCDPMVLTTYRHQFPQLWQSHDLLVRCPNTTSPPPLPQPHSPDPPGYVLRLFVSGYSSTTERTLKILHRRLGQSLDRPYTLKVVDVAQHPDQAELDQVTATPTLVRVHPSPLRRLVGDLDSVERLTWLLEAQATWMKPRQLE
jgi:circadian clock protein KaiB